MEMDRLLQELKNVIGVDILNELLTNTLALSTDEEKLKFLLAFASVLADEERNAQLDLLDDNK